MRKLHFPINAKTICQLNSHTVLTEVYVPIFKRQTERLCAPNPEESNIYPGLFPELLSIDFLHLDLRIRFLVGGALRPGGKEEE